MSVYLQSVAVRTWTSREFKDCSWPWTLTMNKSSLSSWFALSVNLGRKEAHAEFKIRKTSLNSKLPCVLPSQGQRASWLFIRSLFSLYTVCQQLATSCCEVSCTQLSRTAMAGGGWRLSGCTLVTRICCAHLSHPVSSLPTVLLQIPCSVHRQLLTTDNAGGSYTRHAVTSPCMLHVTPFVTSPPVGWAQLAAVKNISMSHITWNI